MLRHGFSCTETTRDGSSTALGDREKCIKNTLTGDKRNTCRIAKMCRSWNTDRPFLGESQISGASVIQKKCYDRFQDRIITVRNNVDNSSSLDIRWNHGFVKNRSRFLRFCNDRTRMNDVTFLYGHMNRPFLLCVERVYTDTTGNILAGGLCNLFQWTLDTVKNVVDDTRSEKNGDGIAGAGDSLSRTESCSLLKNLDSSHALFQSDNFTDKIVLSDIDHLRNLKSGIAFQINDGTIDTVNNTCSTHDSVLRQI